jgi:hypothetical protein
MRQSGQLGEVLASGRPASKEGGDNQLVRVDLSPTKVKIESNDNREERPQGSEHQSKGGTRTFLRE